MKDGLKISSFSLLNSFFLELALVAFAALAFGPHPARAAVTEAWVQRYNNKWVSNSDDAATKVVRDAAGDIIVAGSTDDGLFGPDMLTIKYSGADGTVVWQKRYNGPENSYDYAYAVAVDGSGNVLVMTGSSATVKFAAADGALLWEKRSTNGVAYLLAVDGSGNVVVAGSSYGGASGADYYTAKYAAADGALLWEKRYNGPSNSSDQTQAVTVDGSGNIVVTGNSATSGSASSGFIYDYYTAKYAAADGSLLWEKRYNGPANNDDQARAVALDGSGNVIVTGTSYNATNSDYYTAKYAAADGALLWEQRYNGPANGYDSARAVAVDGRGNVVVIGGDGRGDYYTAKYAAADGALLWGRGGPRGNAQALAVDGSGNVVVTGTSNENYYTAKYATADGALLWEKHYNGSTRAATDSQAEWNSFDYAQAVTVDDSGNVVVTGQSQSVIDGNGNAPSDYYTVKYAAVDGALLWEQRYDGLSNSRDMATAVAVDGSGNVAVTGYTHNDRGGTDYYTAKYAVTDGALLWEQRYRFFIGGGESRANAVAVDGSGNVVVTGTSGTVKYAATDGALLWEQRYDGEFNDSAQALAVDGSGNVVVTGSSYNGADDDYYTAKYAAANGALLWEKRYNGPANINDRANAVAVDASGNVIVTGTSYNAINSDYYTAKYGAADGALLWEQRYNGPVNSYDSAQAVAVDGSGNVIVAGTSYNATNSDYYTAKYAAADGALLWEMRYNGPANGNDGVLTSRSLALGPNRMVAVTGSSSGSYATVVYRENLAPISIALVPTGIRLSFTGTPGLSYIIESASTVTGPWVTLNIQTAPASGFIEYLDAPPAGSAFFRTSAP